MQDNPCWITLKDNVENNLLYIQLLSLINNQEELRSLVSTSGCGGGTCKSGKGCCHS